MSHPPILIPWRRRRPGEQDGPPPTWHERLAALRHVPPLLRLVFETHRGYTAAILGLRVVRAFIPLAVLWVGKLIIDEVVAAMAAPAFPRCSRACSATCSRTASACA